MQASKWEKQVRLTCMDLALEIDGVLGIGSNVDCWHVSALQRLPNTLVKSY